MWVHIGCLVDGILGRVAVTHPTMGLGRRRSSGGPRPSGHSLLGGAGREIRIAFRMQIKHQGSNFSEKILVAASHSGGYLSDWQ